MFRALVLAAVVAVAFAKVPLNKELDSEWELFKNQHNKVYKNDEEVTRRFIWETNRRTINNHNALADMGFRSYRMGMNKFGDMSSYEFKNMMNGYKMADRTEWFDEMYYSETKVEALPKQVDWRKKGYVTEVKDQGQCGSCWAFSATGSLEGQHFKKTGTLTSLSEQNLVDCSGPEGNMGCEGGLMDQAFTYIKKNKGIDTEDSYPYEAEDDDCRFKKSDVGATDTGFVDITSGSEKDLQKAVAEVGPISVAIDASHDSFQFYESGVYDEPQCSSSQLDHGVLSVGYGVEKGKDYWLVKNSWGADWGMKGYIMMSRNKSNQCGIATAASYPKV